MRLLLPLLLRCVAKINKMKCHGLNAMQNYVQHISHCCIAIAASIPQILDLLPKIAATQPTSRRVVVFNLHMGRKRSFANLARFKPILVTFQLISTPNWHSPVAGSPFEFIKFMFAKVDLCYHQACMCSSSPLSDVFFFIR